MKFVVLKFGGTSVATVEGWGTIADAIRARVTEGLRPVVVCSAIAGVSDMLEGLLGAASRGAHQPVLDALVERHRALCSALGVDVDPDWFQPWVRLATGVSLTGEWTPRMQARVLGRGELLSTRIGAAWLARQGLAVRWFDAREALTSDAPAESSRAALCAHCDDAADPELAARFAASPGAVLTQGFIARDPTGATVVLGRGGSDTSAALFAARLSAVRCEIWTDVPGVYTTNPRDVPEARLLRRLDYDEAQELATAGAKVLHPRCLAPLRRHGIPLHVRCTHHPEMDGTVVAAEAPGPAAVKAIAARRGVTLVSMDTLGMWQQVGFLANAFACFARHGISVDLVSTSESNVTASFDPAAGAVAPAAVEALLADLRAHCAARLIEHCAAVTLVGRGIRAILHQLGPALAAFEDRRIHLVSQAASDLNLTVVVDEDDAERLVARLHALLFGSAAASANLGPTWRATFGDGETVAVEAHVPWWRRRQAELLALDETPAYVYCGDEVRAAAERLEALSAVDRVFYAIKANDHPELLRLIHDAGLGLECVSPGELAHVFEACPTLCPEQVLFTPNVATAAEYRDAFDRGVWVTVDAVSPLRAFPDVFAGRDILLRLDPGRGRGHHQKVRTAGRRSKFGIAREQLEDAAKAVTECGARVVGLHAHAGSGVRDPNAWTDVALHLAASATRFPDVRYLDIGGGLGVRQKPGQPALDLSAMDSALAAVKTAYPDFELWMEPGRYLVAEAGVLLTRVVQRKHKGDRQFVGVDAGMNTLIRPALYGAWHEIVNLSRLGDSESVTADVVGPICETGDILGRDRALPETVPGDLLLVATAGAYGRVMSSTYNRRPLAREVIL